MTAQTIVRKQRISRDLILDCARELLNSNGSKSISIRRIAEIIPCAPPSIYYYFRSKQSIIEALMAEPMDALLAELSQVVKSEGTAVAFLQHYASYWVHRPDQLRLLLLPTPGVATSMLTSEQYQGIETTLAGLLANDCLRAEALLGAVNGMLLKLMQDKQGLRPDSLPLLKRYLASLLTH